MVDTANRSGADPLAVERMLDGIGGGMMQADGGEAGYSWSRSGREELGIAMASNSAPWDGADHWRGGAGGFASPGAGEAVEWNRGGSWASGSPYGEPGGVGGRNRVLRLGGRRDHPDRDPFAGLTTTGLRMRYDAVWIHCNGIIKVGPRGCGGGARIPGCYR